MLTSYSDLTCSVGWVNSCSQNAWLGAWWGVVLIGGVARAFNLNMVPEAISKKLEPMDNENESEQLAFHQVDNNNDNLFAYRLLNPEDYDKEDWDNYESFNTSPWNLQFLLAFFLLHAVLMFCISFAALLFAVNIYTQIHSFLLLSFAAVFILLLYLLLYRASFFTTVLLFVCLSFVSLYFPCGKWRHFLLVTRFLLLH